MDFPDAANVSSIFGVVAPLLIGAAFLWVIWRTKSRYVLLSRLWQLVHGKQEISDPQIREFVDEQTSLISFRMFAGVPVASLNEAHQLIEWTKLNGVQMRTLSVCGDLFDPELRQVKVHKLPSSFSQAWRLIGFFTAVAVGCGSLMSLFASQPLLSLKSTQRYFWASPTEVKPLWPLGAAALGVSDCSQAASANAARTTFSEQEVGILCDVLKSKTMPEFTRKALSDQRWALVMLVAFSVWLSWIGLFAWAAGFAAHNLAKRRIDPSLPGSQLSLDLPI
jgi:ABC-type sugar transport system permease subunit